MAIDPVFGAESDWYWSSTSYASIPGNAWIVIPDGVVDYDIDKGFQIFVRAVRAGP